MPMLPPMFALTASILRCGSEQGAEGMGIVRLVCSGAPPHDHPTVFVLTQGPGDLLFTPAGYVVMEKVMNSQDLLGIKFCPIPSSGLESQRQALMSFGGSSEAIPKAMLAVLAKPEPAAKPAQPLADAEGDVGKADVDPEAKVGGEADAEE